MSDLWTYRARPVRVVDGDTIELDVDLGFRVMKRIRVRLLDVDTAEIYGTKSDSLEHQLGQEQSEFVSDFVFFDTEEEWPLKVETYGEKGKYGRWLGDVIRDGQKLTEELIEQWPEVEN